MCSGIATATILPRVNLVLSFVIYLLQRTAPPFFLFFVSLGSLVLKTAVSSCS